MQLFGVGEDHSVAQSSQDEDPRETVVYLFPFPVARVPAQRGPYKWLRDGRAIISDYRQDISQRTPAECSSRTDAMQDDHGRHEFE